MQYQFAASVTHHEASLALRRERNDSGGVAWSLLNFGHFDRWTGCYDDARKKYEQSRSIQEGIGDRRGLIRTFEAVARCAHAEDEDCRARWLFEAALELRDRIRFHLPPVDEKFDYGPAWPVAELRSQISREKKSSGGSLWRVEEDTLFAEAARRAKVIAVGPVPAPRA